MKLQRLLVANRGEIAVRILRSARRLGLHTIAVYSDADAGAAHVRAADEAWRLGPAPPRDSYLNEARILEVAKAARADALHPGYGFLSENAGFAAATTAAGIAFVGPPANAIAAMGSKAAAKTAMHAAGVPVLPGYHGDDQSTERLLHEGALVGYPLIVKPSGGGGGKGMQIVQRPEELEAAIVAARRLAGSAFGDAALLLERYLPAPRHVEVQLLADADGVVQILGTRDCSVQRRHQKLIEEAPAPGLSPGLSRAMAEAARTVAQAIGYRSAGTVEFLLSGEEFFFLEMNTRLQVEHTVTEAVHGIDLVEWQLRIAAGETLPGSDAPPVKGHAIEVRVCAEDPAADFRPSAGDLVHVKWPSMLDGIRVDAGFESGDAVTAAYDSLLGKIIAHGRTRAEATTALVQALGKTRIVGVTTNLGWLAAALQQDGFAEGPTTRFVEEHAGHLAIPVVPWDHEWAAAALACVTEGAPVNASPWAALDAFRAGLPCLQRVMLACHGEVRTIEVTALDGHGARWRVSVGDVSLEVTTDRKEHALTCVVDGHRRTYDIHAHGTVLSLWRGADRLEFRQEDPRSADASVQHEAGALVAMLPGTVVAVHVASGDQVAAGDALLVIEAMKMEHVIRAPYPGIVSALHFSTGDRVTEGAVLAAIHEESAAQAD